MALIFRKKILLAKLEVSYGTDSVPTGAANAIETENMVITPLAGPTAARNVDRPYLGGNLQIQTGQFVELTFDIGAGGGGAATTPPKFAPLLKACGFKTETVGASDVQYTLGSTAFDSLSMYFHHDGQLHKLLGARGDITSINLTPGEIARVSFRFVGLYVTPTSTADATPTYTGWQTPKAVNDTNTTSFQLHGAERIMGAFQFALGNDVQYRNVVGGESVELVNRAPSARFSIEAPTIAAKDWFTAALNSTTGALTVTHGTTAGNIFELTAPAVQVISPTYEEQQGITMLAGSLSFVPTSTGNDEVKITTK